MMVRYPSLCSLTFWWGDGTITACHSPLEIDTLTDDLAEASTAGTLFMVQTGLDGPLDALMNPSLMRYIVVEPLAEAADD